MFKSKVLLRGAGGVLLLWGVLGNQGASSADGGLKGVIKSTEGKALEGVAVTARAQGQRFTTTVYTDQRGQYAFPPLEGGQYRVLAQAVGYEASRAEVGWGTGKSAQQDFVLRTLHDFSKQLSSSEWMASLPEDHPQDLRMKRIFYYNCSSCHVAGIVLQNRFDTKGWSTIVNFMAKNTSLGSASLATSVRAEGTPPNPLIDGLLSTYQEELVGYLARVRGPDSPLMKYKPYPRPVGEAAQIIVTEYELSPGDQPGYRSRNDGSNWSEGTPSKYENEAAHDAVADKAGNVWFTDNITPGRTLGKLNVRTGQITDYALVGEGNLAVGSHGVVVDHMGNVWFTNSAEGSLTKFDPKTEQFQRFARPSALPRVGGTVVVDPKGSLWVTNRDGAHKLDPKTGEYSAYESVTKGGSPYGITIDARSNAWYAQINSDRLGVVDSEKGKVSEVVLPLLDVQLTAKDREIGQKVGAGVDAAPLYQKGPRRLAADPSGDNVWVAEFWSDRLARINIKSKEITEYRLPHLYSHPYAVAVDKNHMVWICLMNSDRIAKFNPFTEKFTEYPLPTLGTEARFISVDNSTDPPTVWIPYNRINKLARVEFRKGAGT